VMSEGPMSSKMNSSSDSISEWRSREQLEASPPSTSPAYWDTDEEDDFNSSSMTGRQLVLQSCIFFQCPVRNTFVSVHRHIVAMPERRALLIQFRFRFSHSPSR
jgi:hypothetical protein